MDDITPHEQQPDAPPPAPEADTLPFRRPADYYSAAGTDLRPLFPRWVPAGCGWASLVFVIVLFAAGAFAPRSGLVLDWLFGKMQDDMSSHFTRDVTPDQRAAFNAEMRTMRAAASAGKLKLDRTQLFLHVATEVDGDDKIDHAEADKLIAALRVVNRSVK
ncbi:MAG TPA: hypothetical protein VLC46_06140 [Thermoanaerobaculia bacterium]|nr:hypothetical protein [Thermoanaerobaculia bacterium]